MFSKIHYPRIKNKVGFFSEKIIIGKGKRDYNRNAFIIKDGFYFSQFIEQEIKICLSTIAKEKELLNRILLGYSKSLNITKVDIAYISEILKKINIKTEYDNCDFYVETDFSNKSLLTFYNYTTQKAKFDAKEQKQNEYIRKLSEKKQNEGNLKMNIKASIDIYKTRCLQRFYILQARIATYMRGVASENSKNESQICSLELSDNIFQSVKKEIYDLIPEHDSILNNK